MNLYEFKLERHYEDGSVKSTDYQIPATSETDALISLGRTYHGDDYDVKVISCELVRIGEGTELDNFRKLSLKLKKEFEAERGDITCEFSTTTDDLRAKWKILQMDQPENGHWHLHVCSVCMSESPTHIIHCEIIRNE